MEINHNLEVSDYGDSDVRNKIDNFSIERITTSGKLSIDKVIQQIKPVVTEKHGIEDRNKSDSNALFGILGPPGF